MVPVHGVTGAPASEQGVTRAPLMPARTTLMTSLMAIAAPIASALSKVPPPPKLMALDMSVACTSTDSDASTTDAPEMCASTRS